MPPMPGHPSASSPGVESPRLWRGVDHLMLRLSAAHPLFDWLHRELALPVTWPLTRADFATYGWIGLGNTHLELWAAAHNDDLPPNAQLPLVHGFALAPNDLAGDLARLRERGLSHRPPRDFASPGADGHARRNFTNAVIETLSGPCCCIFYCDWATGAPIAPWPQDADAQARQQANRAALAATAGGPLGITGLRRIVLRSPDAAATERAWRTATGLPDGPLMLTREIALAIEPGPRLEIAALHLGVRDACTARETLESRQWLSAVDETDVMHLSAPALKGLTLGLIPAPDA